jgi:drug/metabolite transporter (DMT)-like permease
MLHLLRVALALSMTICFFAGLRYLPLAEAVSIAFTAPLFVTALSQPLLGEQVGVRRWVAVIAGFLGAAFMLQPGTAAFRVEALLVVVAALFFALTMLLTRRMSTTETNTAILAYSTSGACIGSIPLAATVWQPPAMEHMAVFVLLGLVGGVGSYFMILAYRNAPAAVVASFDYTALIWASLFGWILWQETPGAEIWIGASVIVGAGLYIIRREAVRS